MTLINAALIAMLIICLFAWRYEKRRAKQRTPPTGKTKVNTLTEIPIPDPETDEHGAVIYPDKIFHARCPEHGWTYIKGLVIDLALERGDKGEGVGLGCDCIWHAGLGRDTLFKLPQPDLDEAAREAALRMRFSAKSRQPTDPAVVALLREAAQVPRERFDEMVDKIVEVSQSQPSLFYREEWAQMCTTPIGAYIAEEMDEEKLNEMYQRHRSSRTSHGRVLLHGLRLSDSTDANDNQ